MWPLVRLCVCVGGGGESNLSVRSRGLPSFKPNPHPPWARHRSQLSNPRNNPGPFRTEE